MENKKTFGDLNVGDKIFVVGWYYSCQLASVKEIKHKGKRTMSIILDTGDVEKVYLNDSACGHFFIYCEDAIESINIRIQKAKDQCEYEIRKCDKLLKELHKLRLDQI